MPDSPDVLIVRRYPLDRALAAHGVDPLGDYPERFWLPIIGPTSYLLGRALHRATAGQVGPVELNMVELGRRLGVTYRGGHRSPLYRSCDRLLMFGLADSDPTTDGLNLLVSALWPPLPQHRARHLTASLAAEHEMVHQ